MASLAKYWRVAFGRNEFVNASTVLILDALVPYDAGGAPLSDGATVTSPSYDAGRSSGPIGTVLADADPATYVSLVTAHADMSSRYVVFTYATEVEWERVKIRFSTATLSLYYKLAPKNFPIQIQSSPNGTEWVVQAVHAPCQAEATDYIVAANQWSTLYAPVTRDTLGGLGGIYGIVSEDGVALPNRPVYLFDRDTFQKIGYTTTDENGGYSFTGLNEQREYAVMSVDPSGPPYKNAIVWDRITPINAKGNQPPLNAFWARRLRDPKLGAITAFDNYIDGETSNFLKAAVGGSNRSPLVKLNAAYNGFSQYPLEVAGGAFVLWKSNRANVTDSPGITVMHNGGLFGANADGVSENFSELTFEYVFVPPASGEPSLFIAHSGTRGTDDFQAIHDSNGVDTPGSGPTLEVTSSAINFRIPLGANNRSIIRATVPPVAGALHHVVVTYKQDTEIKLYLNGTLIQTTAIPGAGRIFNSAAGNAEFQSDWDANDWVGSTSAWLGAIRRLQVTYVCGTGPISNTSFAWRGWGGAFGMAAFYGRVMTQTDVSNLYDSLLNPTTHQVPTTLAGYPAEVEADNPTLYFRLNDTTAPAAGLRSICGRKDVIADVVSTNVYGETPAFVGGTTATKFVSNGGVYIRRVGSIPKMTFSFECFFKPSSLEADGYLFASRENNSTYAPIALKLKTDGKLVLSVTDLTGTLSETNFNNTPLVVGTNYHIVVTYDPWGSKVACLYINGSLVTSVNATTFPGDSRSDILGIGCVVSGDLFYPTTAAGISSTAVGTMGEVAFYDHALTAARALAHYEARNA